MEKFQDFIFARLFSELHLPPFYLVAAHVERACSNRRRIRRCRHHHRWRYGNIGYRNVHGPDVAEKEHKKAAAKPEVPLWQHKEIQEMLRGACLPVGTRWSASNFADP